MHTPTLLTKHPLISDQVNRAQLEVILHELERILKARTDGAVVEFGCYIGTTSLFMRRLIDTYDESDSKSTDRGETRQFHVYDSFEGLPAKTSQDDSRAGEQFVGGELAISKKQFLKEFQKAHLRAPIIHKSWFKDLSSTDIPPQIAFAFLDGDFYESIKDSLGLVLPRLAPHATIVFDDFAREALPGVEKAARELLPPRTYDTIRVSHNLGILRT